MRRWKFLLSVAPYLPLCCAVRTRQRERIIRARTLTFLTVVASLSVCLVAQEVPAPKADSSLAASSIIPSNPNSAEAATGTFSTRVREVNVLFSASDWRGRFVSNLTSSDIKVRDNGEEPQSLTYFVRQSDLPLRIGILMDVSGSVGNVFPDQQQAADIFLQQTMRPSDLASIITFSDQAHIAQEFTGNLEALRDTVHHLKAGEASTAIYDAVNTSCKKLSEEGNATLNRRVLVLITDGEDNSSIAKIENAIDTSLQSEVVIFALNTNLVSESTDLFLKRLAESTGGRLLHARGRGELKDAFRKVNEQLRSQYLLGYKPANWQADHSFHKIHVSTRRLGLRVHCRRGYYATE